MNKHRSLIAAICIGAALALVAVVAPTRISAYPPAVGILGSSKNCLTCHANNGPWKDETGVIIDILDKASGKSLRQSDGTFLLSAKRGESKTLVTVIGWKAQKGGVPAPYRNAWLYVDPRRIADPVSLNKFAPGWAVNLPMSCRVVGDPVQAYPGAYTTALPMTVRPGDDAPGEAEVQLQVMLTRGESVKGKPTQGMEGNYFERRVRLKVE
jgi:hypothetical protein